MNLRCTRRLFPRAGRLLSTVPSRAAASGGVVDAVFTAHCKADRLDHAERLLVTWMRNFDKIEGVSGLISVVGNRESMVGDPSYKLKDISDEGALQRDFPSMSSWHALMTLYVGRQAAHQCKAVFGFLNEIEQRIPDAPRNSEESTSQAIIDGCVVPANIAADERIHKDYVRVLCATESFSIAFQLLVKMTTEKKMTLDAHLMTALLRMVNKPGLVSDAAIPRICNLTAELVKNMHELEKLKGSQPNGEAEAVYIDHKSSRSSDPCLVLNALLNVLCTRGYVEMAADVLKKLKKRGLETDHITAEMMIRTYSLVGKTSDAITLFKEQRDAYHNRYPHLKDAEKNDARLQRSYHMITTGLRKENRLKELAAFMLENGRFVDVLSSKGKELSSA